MYASEENYNTLQVTPSPYNKPETKRPNYSARHGAVGGRGGGRKPAGSSSAAKQKKIEVKGVEPALVDIILNEIEDK